LAALTVWADGALPSVRRGEASPCGFAGDSAFAAAFSPPDFSVRSAAVFAAAFSAFAFLVT
jgi:hypothetical protein